MYSKNFLDQEETVEKIFDEYMSKEGYYVRIYDEDDLKYFGYGGYAVKEDKFAPIFKLHGQVYPRGFSISVEDRNGNFVIMGETVAIYFISVTSETSKKEIENEFKLMLDDIYNKYKVYSKENRLDFVFNEYEVDRKNYDDVKELQKNNEIDFEIEK